MAEKKPMNLMQKLARLRKAVEVLQNNKAGFGYKYVTDDEILFRIAGLMEKLEVSLIPSVDHGTTVVTPYAYTKTKADRTGNRYEERVNDVIVQAEMTFRWVDNVTMDEVVVPWSLIGQQSDASQAFGSGLSYCYRYFLLKYFGVSTIDDDPDTWRSKKLEAEAAENKEIAQAIVQQIREFVNTNVQGNPEREKEAMAIVKQHVSERGKPSVNYLGIKDPQIASALLDDLKEHFGKNDLGVEA